jgi:hypothetical protein
MATWFVDDSCRDVGATRRSFGELVGPTTVWDEPDGVAFTHGCVQLAYLRGDASGDRSGKGRVTSRRSGHSS